jgi:hypothetical protein
MDPVTLALMALATARLTRLITSDFLFDRPRTAALRYLVRTRGEDSKLAYLLVCPWCMSLYTGSAITAAWVAWGESMWFMAAVTILSMSHVAGLLASKGGGD